MLNPEVVCLQTIQIDGSNDPQIEEEKPIGTEETVDIDATPTMSDNEEPVHI